MTAIGIIMLGAAMTHATHGWEKAQLPLGCAVAAFLGLFFYVWSMWEIIDPSSITLIYWLVGGGISSLGLLIMMRSVRGGEPGQKKAPVSSIAPKANPNMQVVAGGAQQVQDEKYYRMA